MFEHTLEIDGQQVTLQLKPFELIPGRVSRMFAARQEQQMWAALEWGLSHPIQWPLPKEGEEPRKPLDKLDSRAIPEGLLDDVPVRDIRKLYSDWQESAKVTAGE